MENLVERINKKGAENRQREIDTSLAKFYSVMAQVEELKRLAPRIAKMWDVANALIKNGFRLGTAREWVGIKYYSLESDMQYHCLGFAVECNTISGFGIVGGGCCGMSILLDTNGQIKREINWNELKHNYHTGKSYYNYENPDIVDKISKILDGFDEYEKRFYEFAESVVA